MTQSIPGVRRAALACALSATATHNAAWSGSRVCGSHLTHPKSGSPCKLTTPTISGPWKKQSWLITARATSAARGPARVIAGNALSCTTIGMAGTVLTAATVRRRLTAHTGSKSSGEPGSPTSIGVHSEVAPSPKRTSQARGESKARSQTRDVGVAWISSAGSGWKCVTWARCSLALRRACAANASRWRRYTRRVSSISPC